MRGRIFVEVSYFAALAEEEAILELKPLNAKQKKVLQGLIDEFTDENAAAIRMLEQITRHDVKAIEYYLKSQIEEGAGTKVATEFLHFALTSEDVNNLAYGILIHDALRRVLFPELQMVIDALTAIAQANKSRRMLALTHGQPATPTTLGKEIQVFVDRLARQRDQAIAFRMQGKFGGAVGNYFAHRAAYPDVNWEKFGLHFVKSLGLEPLKNTTQINPHDDIAQLSHLYQRINTILLNLSRDVWLYISRGVFKQKVVKTEVGSSTMPHKVNPIDFENAEGNLGLSNALFGHFAEKLPVSRLQRDLSDSTVQRNIGVAFGYHLLALKSLTRGLGKLSVNGKFLDEELAAHPEVMAEAIQTVMRRHGIRDAYEQLKRATRGEAVTVADLKEFVEKLKIPAAEKARLIKLMET